VLHTWNISVVTVAVLNRFAVFKVKKNFCEMIGYNSLILWYFMLFNVSDPLSVILMLLVG